MFCFLILAQPGKNGARFIFRVVFCVLTASISKPNYERGIK